MDALKVVAGLGAVVLGGVAITLIADSLNKTAEITGEVEGFLNRTIDDISGLAKQNRGKVTTSIVDTIVGL